MESAIALPHQSSYATFWDQLAAMVRSIAANHALLDGNKRLAHTVLHSTLLVNGYIWVWSQNDGELAIERLAQGDTHFEWLADFLELWSAPVGDRILELWSVSGGDLSSTLAATIVIETIEAARSAMLERRPDLARIFFAVVSEHAQHGLSQDFIDDLRGAAR